MDALLRAFARDLTRAIEPMIREAIQSALPASDAVRPGKGWLTNAETMTYLGLSRPTLARYRKDGRLPYSKVGSSVFYRLADVEALLEANAVRAGRALSRV